MTGSADLFNHDGRGPRASINHVTVHDGFTLADSSATSSKHNEANGEDNRDGSDDNKSTNCGVEGPTDDPTFLTLRRQLRRDLLASSDAGAGVPLLLAGDEVGNSQSGNNNAYCQDNEIGWVDWSGLGRDGDDITDADRAADANCASAFRSFAPRHWVEGRRADGIFGVLWLTPATATEMTEQDWNFPEGRFLSYVLGRCEAGTARSISCSTPLRYPIEITAARRWPDMAAGSGSRHRRMARKPRARSSASGPSERPGRSVSLSRASHDCPPRHSGRIAHRTA